MNEIEERLDHLEQAIIAMNNVLDKQAKLIGLLHQAVLKLNNAVEAPMRGDHSDVTVQ